MKDIYDFNYFLKEYPNTFKTLENLYNKYGKHSKVHKTAIEQIKQQLLGFTACLIKFNKISVKQAEQILRDYELYNEGFFNCDITKY